MVNNYASLPFTTPTLSLIRTDQPPNRTGEVRNDRDVGWEVASLLVLAFALGTVNALLGHSIADRLEQAALAYLPGRQVVYAILEVVDLLDARNLGLV